MQQLTQQLKSGKMEILEVPFPALNHGYIMVRNHFSVISTGTEGKTVTDARKGYIAKAKSRQKEVKQVIELIKTNGLLSTYKLVMNKLEAPSALGYCCAGEVIAVGTGVSNFSVGDWVACGGNSASHADVVAVPKNLAVKIPREVSLKHAAFTTLGSVAIQGVRQASLQMGENCLIIGMGLIGQLTYKICEASGFRVVGIDVSQSQVDFCKKMGMENVFQRNSEGIEDAIQNQLHGLGADAVIITAGTSSIDPVEFAGTMARQKGRVVIVGAVPTGFSRANYYKKELDLRMSSSYGPGRNDLSYEEKGNDYPLGYVRWTENRNMQSFVHLLATRKIDIDPLITHVFELANAPEAYEMILAKNEVFSGVVIEYDTEKELEKRVVLNNKSVAATEPNVGFIGAGNYAQGSLLPNMKGHCNFIGVANSRGNTSLFVAKKYGFNYCAESDEALFNDSSINTIFVSTRHNLHAPNVLKAIERGKHVFVEKPLAMNEEELNSILAAYEASTPATHVMVGFNRRFSPAVTDTLKLLPNNLPRSIVMRINSGVLPPEHWVNDPEIGGGRIVGEACHFVDLAMYLANSPIVSVSAEKMETPNSPSNTVCIQLKMENGSVASINYLANGNKQVAKEFIEVFCGGTIVQIDDFRKLFVWGQRSKKINYGSQDKGHATCVRSFLGSIRKGAACPIPFVQSYLSMLATFRVHNSIAQNRKLSV